MLCCVGKSYKPTDLHKPIFLVCFHQTDLIANYMRIMCQGQNPMRMSYLVVYESRYPQYVHHRGVSIPVNAETGCRDKFKWLDSPNPNLNVVVGAIVGGSFMNKTYIDSWNNPIQGEPSTYISAHIVSTYM